LVCWDERRERVLGELVVSGGGGGGVGGEG